ncbi:MAG TPA: thioredoxin family protein [Terriglobia bacterium]|nr:thioredoxin family protein [Terriglobia bacterium]
MRTTLLLIFGLLICGTPVTAQNGTIQWFKDLQRASAAARETNKPMMIEFWADWCAPCKIMEAEVYTDARVATALRQKMVAVRISFDLQTTLVRQYNVEAIPHIVFTNSFGTELLRHRGIIGAEDLAAVIEALPADISEFNRLDGILQKDKKNFAALQDMASRLRAAGLYESSNGFYTRAVNMNEARKNPALREAILLDMGLNFLDMQDGKQAAAVFERCLKEFPNSDNRARFTLELARARRLLSAL